MMILPSLSLYNPSHPRHSNSHKPTTNPSSSENTLLAPFLRMDIMRRTKESSIMKKHKRLLSSSPSPPRYVRLGVSGNCSRQDESRGARKGYVPVVVGGEGVRERFLIPTQFMSHPAIVALLEMSADEFGYKQDGVLQIPCEPDCLREILKSLPFKKR